ncbi:beta-lactamase family protein [Paenibacillus sp. IB182363]|uniref:Beta-lactamase family protein n=2 Tax=Paenibacillus oceani TaxID=2772510 RepID=A0A927CCE8_9BACL|nr:beta-lactamase family protein [Paenibacillus oceani]
MIEQLERTLTDYEKESFLCGNILITQGYKELLNRSFGQASVQLSVPNTVDTKFHIASVTKMFISAASLMLVEQGLIDLDEHPGTYFERFKVLHPNIRIRHLLSNSSGLHDIYAVSALRFEMSQLIIEKKDFIDYLVHLPQNFQPGERWNYSSTGFIMMGYIFEIVTGMSFEQLLRTLFFSPLGMKATGVDYPRKVNPGRAYGHSMDNGKMINAENDRLSEIVDAPGELYSTTRDLDKWCDALFKGKLLSQESLRKLFTPYYTTTFDPNLQYGLGWFLGSDFQSIRGGTPGFRSEIWYYPALDLRIIMLWNFEKVNSQHLFQKLKPSLINIKAVN